MTCRGTDRCPLCNGPNACAMAAGATDAADCWCAAATFPAHLLARLPAAQRGAACVCAGCANAAAEQVTAAEPDSPHCADRRGP